MIPPPLLDLGMDTYLDLAHQCEMKWWAKIAEAVDPRMWTHCTRIMHPNGRQVVVCQGVYIGHFEPFRDGVSRGFRYHVVPRAELPRFVTGEGTAS